MPNIKVLILLLHRWQHPSIQTTINHIKHRFCSCYTGKYSTGGGVLNPHTALGYTSCCMSFSTPPLMLYFPYSIRTGALTNTNIYIYPYMKRLSRDIVALSTHNISLMFDVFTADGLWVHN